MKNIYRLSLVVLAASVFGACSNYDEVTTPTPGGEKTTTVSFKADLAASAQSRAEITVDFEKGLSGSWDATDVLGVIHKTPGSSSFASPLSFSFDTDSRAFKGSLSGGTGDWHYRAFYPYCEEAVTENDGQKVTVPFKALRVQNGNKYSSAYDVLVADAVSCANAEPGKTEENGDIKFNLNRFTSVLALKLQGGSGSEKIASVMLTAAKPIASEQLTFNIPTSSCDLEAINPVLVATGDLGLGPVAIDSKRITVTYQDGTAPSADYSETFFNVLPDANYGDLTFSICTDAGNAASFTINRSTPLVPNWVYTVDRTPSFAKAATPVVEWLNHNLEYRYELLNEGNSADIEVTVPGGIKSMDVDITAPLLDPLLGIVGLANSMSLTNPATPEMGESLRDLGFPTPEKLLNQQYTFFQIGALIDLLSMVYQGAEETSTADFKFTVTDNADQVTVITMQFIKTVGPIPSVTYNGDADLWANTASFTLANIPAEASVEVFYKKSTESWSNAAKAKINDERTLATAEPKWEDKTTADWFTHNTSVLPYSRIKTGTGIFANNTYDYKVIIDKTEYFVQNFTTTATQVIPDGNMENSELPCFTQTGSTTTNFWGSGNNEQTKNLCAWAADGDNHYAKMQSLNMFVTIAAGNLFTGAFNYTKEGSTGGIGAVSFGQKYTYDARPASFKVKYRSKVGKVNFNNVNGPLAKKEDDRARIFVAIVDWSAQHQVVSKYVLGGSDNHCSGPWDPENNHANVTTGAILGYGSLWIKDSYETQWQNVEIPIQWFDQEAKPTAGNYSLVISCAANAFGEYFNGCATNFLHVDDFQWGY